MARPKKKGVEPRKTIRIKKGRKNGMLTVDRVERMCFTTFGRRLDGIETRRTGVSG
jgi:hypothetical protein